MNSTISISPKTRRLKGSVKLLSLALLVFVVLGALCLYVWAAPTELAYQNYLANLLTATMPTGLGTSFADDCRSFGNIVDIYIEHEKQRHLAFLLGLMYPKYNPMRRLGPVALALKNASDDEQAARKVLQEAKIQIYQFCTDLEKFSQKFSQYPIRWYKHEKLSDKLVMDISNALDKSHEMAGKLETEPNPENALASFRTNRETFLLLFLGRLGYRNQENVSRFLADIEKARNCTASLAKETKYEGDEKLLRYWTEKEEFWINVLKAMLNNDMDKVHELIREKRADAERSEASASSSATDIDMLCSKILKFPR